MLLSTQPNVCRRLVTGEKKSIAVIIARAPEIITCVKISIPDGTEVFIVFDPHSRPDNTRGPGITSALLP